MQTTAAFVVGCAQSSCRKVSDRVKTQSPLNTLSLLIRAFTNQFDTSMRPSACPGSILIGGSGMEAEEEDGFARYLHIEVDASKQSGHFLERMR